ncbi:MAG TPA: phage tail sheath C-terminal domain-containing protein [Bryobacteraceae bacterium]
MPPVLNYPGVYIEELQSAVHTITGVATSIAAFVGWAPQGSTTAPVLVQSFSDYQRGFGGTNGLDSRSYLGYAVNQFFANGGQQAYIVRLVWTDAATATAANVGGTLTLWASSPGQWANGIQIAITVPSSGVFNIQVLDASNNQLENFLNLTVNSAVPVIDNDSQYITFINPATGNPPGSISMPSAATGTLAGGVDGTVLQPKDGVNGNGNFETALNASGSGTGVHLLDQVPIFNLLCVPGEADESTISSLESYCNTKRAFYIVDAPQTATVTNLGSGPIGAAGHGLSGNSSDHAAYYFPWIQAPDPLASNRPRMFPPSGSIAGIYAYTDANRGVWKAPAGIDAALSGVSGLQYVLTDLQNGTLNVNAVNCLRQFQVYGDVVWGARTLQGSDQVGSQWKYVPIRRLALYLESSLYDGTQWVVFEPNDETLWGQIRLNVGSFMQGLFLQGAFQGTTPQQAYFVKCDAENNPQSSIDQGVVNILVGFAPLYPAEFVVIQIQQMAGQT